MAAIPTIIVDDPSLDEFTEALMGRPLRPLEREILVALDRRREFTDIISRPPPSFQMASQLYGTGVVFVGLDLAYEERAPDPVERAAIEETIERRSHRRSQTDRAAQGRQARADMVARALARRK